MKIAMVASEAAPFSKTGGLGDVLGALPHALSRLGESVVVISPFYSMVRHNARTAGITLDAASADPIRVPMGDFTCQARLVHARSGDGEAAVDYYFLENDDYYARPGLYTSPDDGSDYQDNSERFILLCRGALEACKALNIQPDVFHCHDWQTGLLPVYVTHLYREDFPNTGTVFTIHNLAYQGLFWHWDMKLTGLPWALFNWKALEYYGNLSFLKAALVGADVLTTVSSRYAMEIQTPQQGMGMDGVLRTRSEDLHGIINGVDYGVWDPRVDRFIASRYGADDLAGKGECKAALQEEFGLSRQEDVPLIGVVGRLVPQKGFDLLTQVLEQLMERELLLVILGSGQPDYEGLLTQASQRFAGRIGFFTGFSDELAHRIQAGSDMLLMPSRFEPCGLSQLYALRYGTVPIVRSTGGLADTVTGYDDATRAAGTATGFVFDAYDSVELLRAIDQALELYRDDRDSWLELVRRGMAQDWSWQRSAREYVKAYEEAIGEAHKAMS